MTDIIVLDFGSQYTNSILRRCREAGVKAQLLPFNASVKDILEFGLKGLILSGGPSSVYESNAPHIENETLSYCVEHKIPVLGICYGMQELLNFFHGKVAKAPCHEYGPTNLTLIPLENGDISDPLYENVPLSTIVWMSHSDIVTELSCGFTVTSKTDNCQYASVYDSSRLLWGLQYHPEIVQSSISNIILTNFFFKICKIIPKPSDPSSLYLMKIDHIKNVVKNHQVIGALSGGVDSTVAASLLYNSIPNQFHAFIVDTGLLRLNELEYVTNNLKKLFPDLNIITIDASDIFLTNLKGVIDPEEKRKLIGKLFIDVFKDSIEKLKIDYPDICFDDAFLLQGTLYSDIIESSNERCPSKTIKSHHNVGGLPDNLSMKLLEPLNDLFKDEIREMGKHFNLDHDTLWRHPFPGPGLAIRIIGEVTKERVSILQRVDAVFIDELRKENMYYEIDQAFAVLLPNCLSIGVVGDKRSYGMTVVLRAIKSQDFMTAECFFFSEAFLKKCSARIIHEIHEVSRVCVDYTSKPPGTIEWE